METKFKKGDAVTFECAGRKTSGMVECTMREGHLQGELAWYVCGGFGRCAYPERRGE
jgi:hypothetical protein